ncbi:hypothetical protein [Halorubrum sp. DTA46]|uniref:hypothetical protein n=1 Tax=Halorubrum sp. DTA46 TaxID=3402162 RepID=UPI003AABB61C
MVQTASDGVVEAFNDARVVQNGLTAYYIPFEASDVDLSDGAEEITSRHPSFLSFTRNKDSVRDPSRRAVYWARLQERVANEDEPFPLTYDLTVEETESVADIQIPWKVALTANKAVYAAYLAAHGKPNSFLVDALDVSTSTVSQYLSDFKSQRR